MNSAFHRLRPLWISLVVLILTAGIAFAAKPSTPANGHPVAETTETTETSDSETTETETTETETTKTVDTTETTETANTTSGDHCSTDPTTLTPGQLAAMNHGSIVCWAAHQPTPAGYANHGAWVSHWAHLGKGAKHGSAH